METGKDNHDDDPRNNASRIDMSGRQTHNLRARNRLGSRYIAPMADKVRRKRPQMKSMTRPLKRWLYEHKDYPYPNRKEKLILSMESTMTMVQVSNWFANARRRLKNTVHDPKMSWEQRIHKYNKHVTGNAERLSISSSDSSMDSSEVEDIDDEEFNGMDESDNNSTVNYAQDVSASSTDHQDIHEDVDEVSHPELVLHAPIPQSASHGIQQRQSLPTHKYKHSIMQRYLNDTYRQAQKLQLGTFTDSMNSSQSYVPENTFNVPVYTERPTGKLSGQEWSKFRVSGSVGSHEYERMSTSPENTSSSSIGSHRQRHCSEEYSLTSSSDDWTSFLKDTKSTDFKNEEDEEVYWQEIVAAVALTNMARSRQLGK
ncbi:homeobox protein Mohawk-like [Lytechinus variegatus]|uniref:homeobox protein Mohawk-like n=1 Tax=Lytechinus variegatus TaxID=7654 RepID=UPI001BB1BCB4|nr:homeobox protein Mohawk-like [Lytechinus variegatus]